MTQAWMDSNLNNTSYLDNSMKTTICNLYSSMEAYYGPHCSIHYGLKPVVW